MKRTHLFYILSALMVTAGCRKTTNDTIGGQTPDQRIAAALAAYQTKLTGAPNGWIFVESTTGIAYNQGVSQTGPKIVLAYYMQFIDSSNVTMYSDFDTSMAATPKTSGFRVKELTRPALIFDTYNYLHVPCDPNPNISHSPFGTGYGWGTDFEYSFSDSVGADKLGDTIHLLGNLNSASGMLIKATKAQQDAYVHGDVKNHIVGLTNTNKILNYFKRLSIGGVNYDLRIDPDGRSITFSWVDGSGNLKSQTVTYYTISTGIQFVTPIVNGSQTFTGIDNVTFDTPSSTAAVTINGQQGQIIGATAPVKADAAAPARWWNYSLNGNYFWASWEGFHVNGVDDAFGVTSLTNASGTFYVYAYWASFYTNPADLFSPLMLNGNSLSLNSYTSAPVTPPQFTGGKIFFTQLGGTGTTPPGGPVDQSNAVLYNGAGFYLVQTGDKTYDMVLATDAKTWISWFWPL